MSPAYERVVLVNPPWSFEGSRYWACAEPHVPLELLYSQALLRSAGVEARVVDAHLEQLSPEALASRVERMSPNLIVLTTAPSYLFWRCPPPELSVPSRITPRLSRIAPVVAIGPHGSATPRYVLQKLGCAAVVRGEPEMELVRIATGATAPSTVWGGDSEEGSRALPAVVDVGVLPVLDFSGYPIELRTHRHHVFWGEGRGAELEFSRGCPYGCSFCNRRFFRSKFRARAVETTLAEISALKDRGVDYVYFIDEVFGLGAANELLSALASEEVVSFGCQTRLDLWDERRIEKLAAAGCVSVEFGLESPFPDEQRAINKGYHIDEERILELMVFAKGMIPWVQGDLIAVPGGDRELRERTEKWRAKAIDQGVWVSEPVDVFPYPGSDLHDELLGPVDDRSWERALEASSG